MDGLMEGGMDGWAKGGKVGQMDEQTEIDMFVLILDNLFIEVQKLRAIVVIFNP